jgi:hypothetical protein
MDTNNLFGDKARLAREADKINAICVFVASYSSQGYCTSI